MLVVLTNTPTPYRTAFFNELRDVLDGKGIPFHVLFCADVEPGRSWRYDPSELRFAHTLMRGVHPRRADVVFHFNPSVVRLLRSLRPQSLLVAGAWNTPTMLLGSRRSFCPGARRIFWSEGHADNVRHRGGPIPLARRWVLRSFDAFAVPNARSAAHIRSQVGDDAQIVFLPNTVDEDFYARRGERERLEARARLGIAAGARVLVQVSNLIPRKGARELAEAYVSLGREERASSMLAFVGGGALESELREIAGRASGGGEIHLTGAQSTSGVRDWLMAADAFFLPALADANPLAPIEASFASLPIFLSRAAGNSPEVVEEGVNGFCIPEVAPGALAASLRRALSMPSAELAAMGTAARANAERRFRRAAAAESLARALSFDA